MEKFWKILRIFGGICFLILASFTILGVGKVNDEGLVLLVIGIGLLCGKIIFNFVFQIKETDEPELCDFKYSSSKRRCTKPAEYIVSFTADPARAHNMEQRFENLAESWVSRSLGFCDDHHPNIGKEGHLVRAKMNKRNLSVLYIEDAKHAVHR